MKSIKKTFFFILPLFLAGAGLLLHNPAGASSAFADMAQESAGCAGFPPHSAEARNLQDAFAKDLAKKPRLTAAQQAMILQASGLQKTLQADRLSAWGYREDPAPDSEYSCLIKFAGPVDSQSAFVAGAWPAKEVSLKEFAVQTAALQQRQQEPEADRFAMFLKSVGELSCDGKGCLFFDYGDPSVAAAFSACAAGEIGMEGMPACDGLYEIFHDNSAAFAAFAADFNKKAAVRSWITPFPCEKAGFLNSEIGRFYLYRQKNAETGGLASVGKFVAQPAASSGFYEKKTWHPLPPLFPHPIADQAPGFPSCNGAEAPVAEEKLCDPKTTAADCRLLVDKLILQSVKGCDVDVSGFYEKKTWHPLPPLFPHPIADQAPGFPSCSNDELAGRAKALYP